MRLEITRRSDLAVRSLVALARHDGRMKASALADAVGATSGFVPQVLSPLVRAGWVTSDPGPTGGYTLARSLEHVSVLDVVEAVEGPTDQGRCVVTGGACAVGGTCAMHTAWARAREVLLTTLGDLPLSSLVDAGGAGGTIAAVGGASPRPQGGR